MEQTKKKILNQVKVINKLSTSSKLNKIASFILNLFNQIHPIDLSDFKINFTD